MVHTRTRESAYGTRARTVAATASELDLPSPNIELADEGETAQMAAQLGSLGSPAE